MTLIARLCAPTLPLLFLALVMVSGTAARENQESWTPKYDADGRLVRPEGYRDWVYVGTPLTPNELNPPEAPFPEFHNVYIDPASYARFMETGKFPEQTIIVKELVGVGSKAAASGKGYFMGDFIGLEATVKDSRRFPDEPGNWAYFSFGHAYPLADAAEVFPTAACNGCHAASAQNDFVFTQYYPMLRAERQAQSPLKVEFTESGELIRPSGYREWIYVGTPLTPNELNPPAAPFPDFHNVYIHPDDFAHYERTGEFPDGTVLVKELVSVGSTAATSGIGYFMGEYTGLEATIKDSQRYPDEPGNWAYFTFGHSYPLARSAAVQASGACNVCHQTLADDDWVFTQHYPVLSAAKGRGEARQPSGPSMTSESPAFVKIATTMQAKMKPAFEPTAETPVRVGPVPIDRAALFAYLKAGKYKELPFQESSAHPSRGPHSNFGLPVRVFMDAKSEESMRTGREQHPVGSSIVKEMFTRDNQLQGWAVMVKTQESSDDGRGWLWYETTNTEDVDDFVAYGNGVPLCFGCHSGGKDFFLTSFPLK